ncbi:MAG: HD domain-containing protein [Patescibacteria group bacterium]
MNKLTQKSAKIIAEKYFKKLHGKEEQDFAIIHSEAVVEVATILAKKYKADVNTVITAGWVHDIGYAIEKPMHAKHSVDLLKKEGFEITQPVEECILNHGTDGKPVSKEAKILQMADKLSIINISILKLLFKQKNILPEDIEFMIKMATGAIEHLKKINF